jgi:hypothetical protein
VVNRPVLVVAAFVSAAFVGVTIRGLGRASGEAVLEVTGRTQRYAFQARCGEPINMPVRPPVWLAIRLPENRRSTRSRRRARGKSLISSW